jgi:hypothetical protein
MTPLRIGPLTSHGPVIFIFPTPSIAYRHLPPNSANRPATLKSGGAWGAAPQADSTYAKSPIPHPRQRNVFNPQTRSVSRLAENRPPPRHHHIHGGSLRDSAFNSQAPLRIYSTNPTIPRREIGFVSRIISKPSKNHPRSRPYQIQGGSLRFLGELSPSVRNRPCPNLS